MKYFQIQLKKKKKYNEIKFEKIEHLAFSRIFITSFLLRLFVVFYARIHDYLFEVFFY